MSKAEDPFLWLEEVRGARAMAWVEAENARSLAILRGDLRHASFHAEALRILSAPGRLPLPRLLGDAVYNFWQDETHVRGVWRRSSAAGFRSAEPPWEVVLDLDELAETEASNWVWAGADVLEPACSRCLISLSEGGEDAKTVREFDLGSRAFVADGFRLQKGKQQVGWLDDDNLILARDWGESTTTASGYAFVVKALGRGQGLDQAVEVFRGTAADVLVHPHVLRDGDGRRLVLIERATDFFHREVYEVAGGDVRRLQLPAKVDIHGLVAGQLVFTVLEDWSGYNAGDLVAFPPEELVGAAPPAWVGASLIFSPGPRQTLEQAAPTARRLAATILDNVSAAILTFAPGRVGGWARTQIPGPPHASAAIVSTSMVDDTAFLTVESFVSPARLIRIDAATGSAEALKEAPSWFDEAGATVEQHEAVSSDGTAIPYFVLRPAPMRLDGDNPTLLYAYGGFEVSLTPAYSGVIGKLWVERGGVYVLANIRGGGEFGPAWHEAGLKTRRQLIYDDFAAVACDLIARNITSPRRLGIQGGSNGGLLMGVQLCQRPELWRAAAIEVPLLDMLRFEQIGAGASWAAEYGSVEVPEERAFLERISPYHNLKPGLAYPEPLFVTATSDDRVSPVHARKMAAKMQAMGLPFLFFENTDGGHAASANLVERAERVALEFTYFARKLMD